MIALCLLALLFQSTPLREGRRYIDVDGNESWMFQSTPLREGRRIASYISDDDFAFQSTPLREGRQRLSKAYKEGLMFQSTPLREGRRNNLEHGVVINCFNPRPCARGDQYIIVPYSIA